jgi:ATP-binding cassette subfamily B protein
MSSVEIDGKLSDPPPAWESMRRVLARGFRSAPRLLIACLALALLAALPDALIAVWLTLLGRGVLDADSALVYTATAGLAVSAVATWALRIALERVQRRFRDRMTIALEGHVARLQADVPTVAHHERPELLDRLAVLRDQVYVLDHIYRSMLETGGWVVRLVVTIVLLASVHPALILLALFALPTVLTNSRRPVAERAAAERAAPAKRLARHFFLLSTTPGPGKEIRLSGVGDRILDGLRDESRGWYALVARQRWISAAWHAGAWAIFGTGYVGAIVLVVKGLHAPAVQVLLVLAAGARLSGYISATAGEIGFLRGTWMDGSRRLAWLEDYVAAHAATRDATVPDRLRLGIQLENVTFRYPGTDRPALEDISLTLPAGSVVALVGENGAGKSTLVKLLAQMYAPTSGRILVDGQDLSRMPMQPWRERLTGAFQDFFRFELVARESVGVGDVPRVRDEAAVRDAIRRGGAQDVVDRLGQGLDTQLGAAWPDGAELSQGQWQKLALSRAFMRAEPLLVVLDEPTSALDAQTEDEVFRRYAETIHQRGIGNGGISLLVSHRFSTVRMADLIIVLDGSRLAEYGSHDDLMAAGGTYAQLYGIQVAAYR